MLILFLPAILYSLAYFGTSTIYPWLASHEERVAAPTLGLLTLGAMLSVLFISTGSAILGTALPFALSIVGLRRGGQSLRAMMSSRSMAKHTVIGTVAGAAHAVCQVGFVSALALSVPVRSADLLGTTTWVLTTPMEEVIFRAYGKLACEHWGIRGPMAALVTSCCFSAAHLQPAAFLGPIEAAVIFIPPLTLGLFAYALYLQTQTLLAPIIAHLVSNAVLDLSRFALAR